jgi:glycosyltransferase involved in cell wall biosynthesis
VYVAGAIRHPDNGEKAAFPNIYLLGRLSRQDLADWYSIASIYVLPARYEPFGLTVLEAALSGCALVLGDIASLRETWENAALFVDPEDPGQLEIATKTLISDATYRERMARRAKARALSYTPERMAEGYMDVYRALLNDAPGDNWPTQGRGLSPILLF